MIMLRYWNLKYIFLINYHGFFIQQRFTVLITIITTLVITCTLAAYSSVPLSTMLNFQALMNKARQPLNHRILGRR